MSIASTLKAWFSINLSQNESFQFYSKIWNFLWTIERLQFFANFRLKLLIAQSVGDTHWTFELGNEFGYKQLNSVTIFLNSIKKKYIDDKYAHQNESIQFHHKIQKHFSLFLYFMLQLIYCYYLRSSGDFSIGETQT